MKRQYVKDLANGDTVNEVFLVGQKHLRANRSGNLYLQLDLRDRTGSVGACMWNATESLFNSFQVNDYVRVRGKAQIYQGALQLILTQLEVVEAVQQSLRDFLPHTEQDIDRLLARLRAMLQAVANPHLRALAEAFLMDETVVGKLCTAPAGIKHHHAYVGGLLEHVVQLVELAGRVAPLYPALDGDLLLIGALVHDIGKIDELEYLKAFAYSDQGQLLGHLAMGVEYVERKAAEAAKLTGEPFPQELLWRIKHMILSHHGSYECGSPKLPMTLEAMALHHLDNLDSKLAAFLAQVHEDRDPASHWTPYVPLLGRKLFKKGMGDGAAVPGSAAEPDS